MNDGIKISIEGEILWQKLQYYFEQEYAIEIDAEESMGKAETDILAEAIKTLESKIAL